MNIRMIFVRAVVGGGDSMFGLCLHERKAD